MTLRLAISLPVAVAAILVSSASCADDRAANALYREIAEAHAALDTEALEPLYAPDATYLPRGSDTPILSRADILSRERAAHDRMRRSGAGIRLAFRVVDRKRFGDVYLDNGYMRTTLTAPGEATGVTVSKFILVMVRRPDGRYRLVSDADSDAPSGAFEAAVRKDGLVYDG